MNAISQQEYLRYLPLLFSILLGVFLVTGSIVAFRAKKNGVTILMLISALTVLIGSISCCFLIYKMTTLLSGSISLDITEMTSEMKQIKKYSNLNFYISIVSGLAMLLFSVVFAIFCCNIANIRKRNEQLETLCKRLADQAGNNAEK